MMLKPILLTLFLTVIAGPAAAQLAAESNAPVDITGDTAEFQDDIAIWTGNVRVIQAEAILTADKLRAVINEDGDVQSITAIGSVRYSNGKEAITGERAVFNETRRTITISENVIVTQGRQVMSAGRVIYWIDTGKVKFAPEEGQRIRGIFYTSSDEQS